MLNAKYATTCLLALFALVDGYGYGGPSSNNFPRVAKKTKLELDTAVKGSVPTGLESAAARTLAAAIAALIVGAIVSNSKPAHALPDVSARQLSPSQEVELTEHALTVDSSGALFSDDLVCWADDSMCIPVAQFGLPGEHTVPSAISQMRPTTFFTLGEGEGPA